MKCRIRKPNSQKALETMRENYPDVSDKILSLIAGYGQTIVEEAPNHPGVTSTLYSKWLELMGNEAQAVSMAAYAYTDAFTSLPGHDWVNDPRHCNLIRETDGTPKLHYKIGNIVTPYYPIAVAYTILAREMSKHYTNPDDEVDSELTISDYIRPFINQILRIENGRWDTNSLNETLTLYTMLKNGGYLDNVPPIQVCFAEQDLENPVLNGLTPNAYTEYVTKTYDIVPVNASFENFIVQSMEWYGQIGTIPINDEMDRRGTPHFQWSGNTLWVRGDTGINNLTSRLGNNFGLELYHSLHNNFPQREDFYRKNPERFRMFLQGVAHGCLTTWGRPNVSVVKRAIAFEKTFANPGIRSLYQEPKQLEIDFPAFAPMPHPANPQYKLTMQEILDATPDQNNIDSLLQTIADHDPYLGSIAHALIGKVSADVQWRETQWMVTDNTGVTRYTDGAYSSGNNTIELAKNCYNYPSKLILHEAFHAATTTALRMPEFHARAEKILANAQKLIFKKYNVTSLDELKQLDSRLSYTLSNTDEFFASLWTDSKLIKELNSVGTKAKKSLLSRIKDFLLNILGINDASEIFVEASDLLNEMLYMRQDGYTEEELAQMRELLPEELYQINAAPPSSTQSSFTFSWNAQQKQAIDDIAQLIAQGLVSGHRKICRIIGKAGTGKTSICPAILQLLQRAGANFPRESVCVAAIANQAKNNLLQKFPLAIQPSAKSVAALLGKQITYNADGQEVWIDGDSKRQAAAEKFASGLSLLIVDEASMLSDSVMEQIEEMCPMATIIYVGDKRQVRPVEANYNPNTPFVVRNVDYSIELVERVRQGEGAAILDIADVYGDVSGNLPTTDTEVINSLKNILQQMNTETTQIQDTNAVVSINSNSIDQVVDSLMPLVLEAVETGNINKIGIVPFFDKGATAARTRFNNLIRYKLLQKWNIDVSLNPEDGNKYIENVPYQRGEMIVFNAPHDLGDMETIDNGTKAIVLGSERCPDSPDYHINWRGHEVTIPVFQTVIEYKDGGRTFKRIIYTIQNNYQKFYQDHFKELASVAFSKTIVGEARTKALKKFFNWKKLNANVSPCWALNVHKAQGQTYEVAYVPMDDFVVAYNMAMKRNEPMLNQCSQLASELYTAITRASNVTIIGKSTFQTPQIDFAALNKSINERKRTVSSTVKEILETRDEGDDKLQQTQATVIVPEKYRQLYDFLKFVTGSDQAFKNLKTPEGRRYAQNLSQMFFQRETELLKFNRTFGKAQIVNGEYDFKSLFKGDPTLIQEPITKERLASLEQQYGPFQTVDEVTVKKAQAVVPNQYATTFKLGSHSLAEVLNPQFFKHVNSYYYSEVDGTDFLVRLHNGSFNVAFVSATTDKATENFGHAINIQRDQIGYRLDSKGNRMYWLPKNAVVYSKTSESGETHETIVIPENAGDVNGIVKLIFKSIQEDIVSIQPFLTNIKNADVARNLIQTAELYSVFSITEPKQTSRLAVIRSKKANLSMDEIKKQLMEYYDNENIAKTYARKFSMTLYNSFIKACLITSSRIPTQALASFMDMEVVAYQPEAANEVFVSIWQLWLQGSDLDIDKSYMMGHSFGSTGLFHHWSPIADYSTEVRRKISDELPVPNGLKLVLNDGDDVTENSKEVTVTFNGSNPVLNDLFKTYVKTKSGDEAFRVMKEMLNDFNITKQFDLGPEWQNNPQVGSLIFKLNKHNLHHVTEEEAKNVAVDSIMSVCSDPRNVQSAHSPIDMATKRLKQFLIDLEVGNIGDENDNLALFQLQEDNQTGKKVVGVMANALKAFLTITQYYNNYYHQNQNISPTDRPYFLNRIIINKKSYYMSTVANATLEKQQLTVLKNALLQYARVSDDILQTQDDVSIILSAMVTLATDNAKELALAKLHASLNLASMHTYLLSMGVPFDDVVKYTAKSPLFTDLYELTKANSWESENGKLNANTWKALMERASQFTAQAISDGKGYTKADVVQLQNLHSWANEFRVLTQLLGINQGMNNGITKAISFKLQFENIIKNRFRTLDITMPLLKILKTAKPQDYGFDSQPNYEVIDLLIQSHGLSPTQQLRDYYLNQISEFVSRYGEFDYTKPIDMNRYYTDESYRDMITDLYNIVKATVNVFDVINHSPNFYTMLESMNTIVERVSKGAKGEFLFHQLPALFNPMLAGEVDVPFIINDTVVKDAQSFCDDYFISNFLVNQVNDDYKFVYEINPSENHWERKEVTFDSQKGLEEFSKAFNILVARLKRMHKNELTKSLILYERKDGKTIYKLNFNLDALNKDQAGEQQLKYQQIVGGFSDIMNIKVSTLFQQYNGNPNMTVGDMFYLYNLIFNLGARGQNTLTSLLDNYVAQSGRNDSLVLRYLQTVLSFDEKKIPLTADSKKVNYHLFKRYASGQVTIGGTVFNPATQILTNFDTVQKYKQLQNTYQRFIAAYVSGRLKIDMDLNCN